MRWRRSQFRRRRPNVFAAIRVALVGPLLSAAALCLYGCWALGQWGAADTAMTATAVDLDAAVKRLNGPTGTITEADKLLLALKSTTVHADMVIAHEDKNLRMYDQYIARVAGDLQRVSQSLSGAADAGRDSAQAATEVIQTADKTIAAARPLIEQGTVTEQMVQQSVAQLNRHLTDPHVDALMLHLDATTGHIEGIAASTEKIARGFEKQSGKRTWWRWK
jgi:hypothetical protein